VSVAEARALGGGARLFLRRLRLEPGPPLTMLALLGVTCFLFAALPRLFNTVADDGLRYTVAHTPTAARNVRVLEWDRLPAGTGADPLATVAEGAARSRQALPPSLRRLAVGSALVIRSPRYAFQPDVGTSRPVPGPPTSLGGVRGLFRYVTVAVHSRVNPHIRLVAGRMPAASGERVSTRVTQPVLSATPGQLS